MRQLPTLKPGQSCWDFPTYMPYINKDGTSLMTY